MQWFTPGYSITVAVDVMCMGVNWFGNAHALVVVPVYKLGKKRTASWEKFYRIVPPIHSQWHKFKFK